MTAMPRSVSIERTDDIALLKRLHLDTFPSDSFPEFGAGWWWVMRDDTELPLGFCGMQPSSKFVDAVYLVRAGVIPKARGLGLQARMIRVRERHARRLGMRWAITYTYCNPASANSLIRCGYRIYEPSAPWGGDGSIYWRKPL